MNRHLFSEQTLTIMLGAVQCSAISLGLRVAIGIVRLDSI
jgi:hypothetical protein